jgi:hypothetical protein
MFKIYKRRYLGNKTTMIALQNQQLEVILKEEASRLGVGINELLEKAVSSFFGVEKFTDEVAQRKREALKDLENGKTKSWNSLKDELL